METMSLDNRPGAFRCKWGTGGCSGSWLEKTRKLSFKRGEPTAGAMSPTRHKGQDQRGGLNQEQEHFRQSEEDPGRRVNVALGVWESSVRFYFLREVGGSVCSCAGEGVRGLGLRVRV